MAETQKRLPTAHRGMNKGRAWRRRATESLGFCDRVLGLLRRLERWNHVSMAGCVRAARGGPVGDGACSGLVFG